MVRVLFPFAQTCLFLVIFNFCAVSSAFADPEINLKGTIISDTMLQKMGCLTAQGKLLHAGCNLSSVTDLTKPFHTPGQSIFVVTQGPADDTSDGAGLYFCFSKGNAPSCSAAYISDKVALSQKALSLAVTSSWPFWLCNEPGGVSIFYPPNSPNGPLLQVTPDVFNGGPGAPNALFIFAYRRKSDAFDLIFSGTSHGNVNAETKLITTGPLAGDVAANYPTARWPYSYEITVYRLTASEHYIKILNYKGKSKWDDGNGLAVIDAEMPEIEKRLGVWRANQPLPTPATMPSYCKAVQMHDGLEWCS